MTGSPCLMVIEGLIPASSMIAPVAWTSIASARSRASSSIASWTAPHWTNSCCGMKVLDAVEDVPDFALDGPGLGRGEPVGQRRQPPLPEAAEEQGVLVAKDGDEPGGQLGVGPEPGERLHGGEEGLLGEVGGRLGPGERPGEAVDAIISGPPPARRTPLDALRGSPRRVPIHSRSSWLWAGRETHVRTL